MREGGYPQAQLFDWNVKLRKFISAIIIRISLTAVSDHPNIGGYTSRVLKRKIEETFIYAWESKPDERRNSLSCSVLYSMVRLMRAAHR